MDTVLRADRVSQIFLDCLFKDGEDKSNFVNAEGITSTVEFNPDRLNGHKAEIEAMLDELFQLGIAIGKVECLLPREMWPTLPGGMPYYVVN